LFLINLPFFHLFLSQKWQRQITGQSADFKKLKDFDVCPFLLSALICNSFASMFVFSSFFYSGIGRSRQGNC
jgi:hypothetical protein